MKVIKIMHPINRTNRVINPNISVSNELIGIKWLIVNPIDIAGLKQVITELNVYILTINELKYRIVLRMNMNIISNTK